MPFTTRLSAGRRHAPIVQHFRGPLTRIGYFLAPQSAHLVLLVSGEVGLRGPEGDRHPVAQGPRLLWWRDGGRRELLVEGGARGTLVSIPDLALIRALPATPLGEQIGRTLGQSLSLVHELPSRVAALVDGLAAERGAGEPGADVAEAHYLALVLIQLWRLARADLVAHGRAPQGLAERFVQLAGQHAREHWRVGDYARRLAVSRDRLGSAVRRATGLSPQDYLHRALIREATELLANTGMPVAQIAFRLGYSDPAYFTRFFTRQVGTSPGRFRRRAKAKLAAGDMSYAAWP
jgi:AraC family transcriptional regulator, transcriptional activator of pobA